jgi:hypothetical protein
MGENKKNAVVKKGCGCGGKAFKASEFSVQEHKKQELLNRLKKNNIYKSRNKMFM